MKFGQFLTHYFQNGHENLLEYAALKTRIKSGCIVDEFRQEYESEKQKVAVLPKSSCCDDHQNEHFVFRNGTRL